MKTASKKPVTKPANAHSSFFQKNDAGFFGPQDATSSFFENSIYRAPVQAKLIVGKPNDKYEKEADATSDKVVQRVSAPRTTSTGENSQFNSPASQMTSFDGNKTRDNEQQDKLLKKEEEDRVDENRLQRKPIFESNADPDDPSKEKRLQKKENGVTESGAPSFVESKLNTSKGGGHPLPENLNRSMSHAFGSDFSKVRVHTDSQAVQMSKDLNAQAFTHGRDIYFNSGKYNTTSKEGQHLLAHELTHTVQQGETIRREPKKDTKDEKPSAKESDPEELKKEKLTKGDHKGYITRTGKKLEVYLDKLVTKKYLTEDSDDFLDKPIKLPAASEERKTRQIQEWKKNVKDEVQKQLKNNYSGKEGAESDLSLTVKKRDSTGAIGNLKQLTGEAAIPFWSVKGSPKVYDVEHRIDWQVAGDKADVFKNLILLDRAYNRTLGTEVRNNIHAHIEAILTHYRQSYKGIPGGADSALASCNVKVNDFQFKGEKLDDEKKYEKDWILAAGGKKKPFDKENILVKDAKIPKGMFLLKTSESRAGYLIPYNRTEEIGAWEITSEFDVKNDKLISLVFEIAVKDPKKVLEKRTIEAGSSKVKKLKMSFDEEKNLVYKIKPSDLKQQYGAAFKELYGEAKALSPIQLNEPEVDGLDVSLTGKVIPTLNFLKDVDISFGMDNGEFFIKAEVPLNKLAANFPKPFKVDTCSLIIAASSVQGLSVYGDIGFTLGKFGEGEITAGANSKEGVFLDGTFNFNSKWFKPAMIHFGYRKADWIIEGEIGVQSQAIKGIKSASLKVGYTKGTFSARGNAELTVPGVKTVALAADIDTKGNFMFMADVALGKLPGINSGNVQITVTSKEDDENIHLKAEGKATPDFPSIKELSGEIAILYDDGLFDARLKMNYKKGRFDGAIEVGVTNRQVDDKGQPAGEPGQTAAVVVFGFGSLTVTLFKNIKGTVTVRLTPERDLLVSGDIELKDLSPFGDGYKLEKELLKFPRITIPLVGIPGLSISAFIDGGVYFKFSWQPLILKQLKVGFKETNINELENATLDIHGSVGSMADAEVYMTINAGLEARVLVATLSGSIGGEAGLGINAEAGGDLDASWNKDKGLQLKEIRAFLNVTPRAVFRLTGKVSVDLDLWITTVNLYSHKYVFAEKALDLSGLALKLDFPIKFDEDNNLIMPEVDKINLQKPDFSGSQGQDILDKAINGDAEKELETKKQEIKSEVKKSLREKSRDEDFSFSDYTDQMVEKYGKSEELKQFVLKTIEDESIAMEYERFDQMKGQIRYLQVPLENKIRLVDMLSLFNRYVKETDVQIFREELIKIEEERKLKEAAANKESQAGGDQKQATTPASGSTPVNQPLQRRPIFESEGDNELQRKMADPGNAQSASLESTLNDSKGHGSTLPESVQNELQPEYKNDLSDVHIHTDETAAQMNDALQAQAFTQGNDIYFNKGEYNTDNNQGKHLLAHELAHVTQQQSASHSAKAPDISRHWVEPKKVERKSRIEIFGDGTAAHPALDLSAFKNYTEMQQADWFVDPSLSAADRKDLWRLLFLAKSGSAVLAGSDNIPLPDLLLLNAMEWEQLKAFGRGRSSGMPTVRIDTTSVYALPQRLALGNTLLRLESIIPKEVLELTVTEAQLNDLNTSPDLLVQLWLYWFLFKPHLQQKEKDGGRNIEFEQILKLIKGPMGILPYLSLTGRIRNLHRFTEDTRKRLIINFADTSHTKPLQLVIHSAHDPSGSFVASQKMIESLVLNLDTLVLVLEGMGSLADITTQIPLITQLYGKPDAGGIYRIARIMFSGHGETRSQELAGTGPATVAGESVTYNSESMDLDDPAAAIATQKLMDTLLQNLDPANARIVFDGCLVGSNKVPAGMAAANIPAHIAGNPNLKTFVEGRAAALGLGMPANLVQGARASLGGAPDSIMDARGNLELSFRDDPDAFGTAAAYIATGNEPAGLMRSAVELAAIDPVVAAAQLRIRRGRGVTVANDWWQEITIAFVDMALDGVAPGTAVSLARLHTLAAMVDTVFLCRWPTNFGIGIQNLITDINSQAAWAPAIYARITATNSFITTPDEDAEEMRLMVEQARIAQGEPRQADLIAFIGTKISIEKVSTFIDLIAIGANSPVFFPLGGLSPGKIRLAIAWVQLDPANMDTKNFLNNEVTLTPAGPKFSAAVQAELDVAGIQDTTILEILGRIGKAKKDPDEGNAQLKGQSKNRAFVRVQPYEATVVLTISALYVRRYPHMGDNQFAVVHPGDKVNVMGFVHDWAAIDHNGELGFVYKTKISAPPR